MMTWRKTLALLPLLVLAVGCGRPKWPAGTLVRVDAINVVTVHWRSSPKTFKIWGVDMFPVKTKLTEQGRERPANPADRRRIREATTLLQNLLADKQIHPRTDGGAMQSVRTSVYETYLEADGVDVGAELIAKGLAMATEVVDHPRKARYLRLQAEAKAAKLGWWADDPKAAPSKEPAKPKGK